MRKRIDQLLNGIFEYQAPLLVIQPGILELSAIGKKKVTGSFFLSSEDKERIQGLVYASSPRVLIEPVQFLGVRNEIRYQIDLSGISDKEYEEGSFTICSELGEQELPYRIQLKDISQEEEKYSPWTVEDLTALAKEHFQEAYGIFVSNKFEKSLEKNNREQAVLYESIKQTDFTYRSLEEFLCACACKDPVSFTCPESEKDYGLVEQSRMEELILTQNAWGFAAIQIVSDAPFLQPEKSEITTEEYAGKTLAVRFLLNWDRMHTGKNQGCLRIRTGLQEFTIRIQAEKTGNKEALEQRQQQNQARVRLEKTYISYRLGKVKSREWINTSRSVIEAYREAGGEDSFAELFLVQLHYASGEKIQARKLLEQTGECLDRGKEPSAYAFYQYLTTYFYQEEGYVSQIEKQIQDAFWQNPDRWILLWILLFMNGELTSNAKKRYEALRLQYERGCNSRILYLEGYLLLADRPYYMAQLTDYDIALLDFSRKEEVLTLDMVRQLICYLPKKKDFQKKLFRVLCYGYEKYPEKETLQGLIQYLILGKCRREADHAWYEKGMAEGLQIKGLHEYYLASATDIRVRELPQVLQTYLNYDNRMPYEKKAEYFADVIVGKDTDSRLFYYYRPSMREFAAQQLEQGHFTPALEVLYHAMLPNPHMNRQAYEQLFRLLCTYELKCPVRTMKKMILHSPNLREETVYPLEGSLVTFQMYDPECVILLEDARQVRYFAGVYCTIRPLFRDERLLKECLLKYSELPQVLLYVASRSLARESSTAKELVYIKNAVSHGYFSEEFRRKMRKRILDYYVAHTMDESLSDFMHSVNLPEFVEVDKAAVIILLAEEGMCEAAFGLLDRYGAEEIPLIQLVRICSRMILASEFDENRMLLALCWQCFSYGKYDDKILRYLILFYEGPLKNMLEIWQAAVNFELDTLRLEEKILTLLLFCGSTIAGTERVFENYCRKIGKKKICQAYVIEKAYEYFVKDLPAAAPVFSYLEKEITAELTGKKRQQLPQVCRLALLRYYSDLAERTKEQETNSRTLLQEFFTKRKRFSFWTKFPEEYLRPYQMEGRVFAEYAADPSHQVLLHFVKAPKQELEKLLCQKEKETGGDQIKMAMDLTGYRFFPYMLQKETMVQRFEGIFEKEFVLFPGQAVLCMMLEITEHQVRNASCRLLSIPSDLSSGEKKRTESRYQKLCELSNVTAGEKAEQLRRDYLLQSYYIEKIFTPVGGE